MQTYTTSSLHPVLVHVSYFHSSNTVVCAILAHILLQALNAALQIPKQEPSSSPSPALCAPVFLSGCSSHSCAGRGASRSYEGPESRVKELEREMARDVLGCSGDTGTMENTFTAAGSPGPALDTIQGKWTELIFPV